MASTHDNSGVYWDCVVLVVVLVTLTDVHGSSMLRVGS